jgi:hypothetical protein
MTACSRPMSRHAAPLAWLIILVLAANFPALSGMFRDNPALYISGLGADVRAGLWPGRANWYDPTIGFVTQALGYASARDWLRGTIPWWNFYAGVGMPQAAELQNEALFLPFVLLLHCQAGWLWQRVLLQILSGMFTYALLIELKLSRAAALIAGVLYACMGSVILIAHAPVATFIFTPLLLIGIEHARRAARRQRPMGWSIITVAVAGSFYAGFPETAFFGNLLGACWMLAELPALPRPAARLFFTKCLLGVSLGLILALPGLIPFLQYIRLGELGAHDAVYATAHLPAVGLAIELLPLIFGPLGSAPVGAHPMQADAIIRSLYATWGNSGGWIGMLPILLAISGLFTRTAAPRNLKYLLFLWFLLWQLRVFGAPVISGLISALPIVHMIDVERFAEPSCDFAIILLAAFAIDGWRRGERLPIGIISILGASILAIAVVCALPVIAALRLRMPVFGQLAWLYLLPTIAMLAFAILTLAQKPGGGYRACLAALILIDTVGGFALSQTAGSRTGHLDLSGVRYLSSHIGLQRVFSLGPLAPNYGAQFGIAEIGYNMLPIPRAWADFVLENLDQYADPIVFNGNYEGRPTSAPNEAEELQKNLAAYEAVGVKYVLAPPHHDPFTGMSGPAPPLVFSNPVMDIYQLPNPAPYFAATGAACTLVIKSRQSLTADCPAAASLLRREMFYPGWHATINGAPAAIVPAATIFQSVPLPPGESTIRFFYRPDGESPACLAAGAAALVWLIAALSGRFRARPRPAEPA